MATQKSRYELARSGDMPQTRSGRAISASIIGSHAALGPVMVGVSDTSVASADENEED